MNTLNPLQTKLLEMFRWLTAFLESNNLRYYMIGGTFLGAVRHNGFIPWDDDIDIAMPRKDYEKLLKLFYTPIDKYVLESSANGNKDFVYNMAKLYDTTTSMTEAARYKIKRGVYIDIFPLDGLGNSIDSARSIYKKIDRLNVLLSMISCGYRKERPWWKNMAVMIGRLIPIQPNSLARKVNTLCMRIDFDKSRYVANCMSTYRGREIMDKTLLGAPTDYQFEDIIAKGPEKANEYLTHIFHDWKKLPPLENQHSAHDFVELDLNHSYLEKL